MELGFQEWLESRAQKIRSRSDGECSTSRRMFTVLWYNM